MTRRSAADTQDLILEILHKARRPLSAYDILGRLAEVGIKSPPTVYRALDQLQEKHTVHRLAGLNAYIACGHQHEGNICAHNHAISFAICRECGQVAELAHTSLDQALSHLSSSSGYSFADTVIELYGVCGGCSPAARTESDHWLDK